MGGRRWGTPAEHNEKKQAGHRTGMLSVILFFYLKKVGGEEALCLNITVFPFDSSPPHLLAFVRCLLSSLWSCFFHTNLASVS